MFDVCIIGAGAAGLVAAGSAARAGAKVAVLEKNQVPGRKLAITGKGRCNVTNSSDRDEFMRNLPGNGQFLFSCLAAFSPEDTVTFFEGLGVKLKTERGGRIFPESDDAKEIVDALVCYCLEGGVEMKYNSRVSSIDFIGAGFELSLAGEEKLRSKTVVIATGGASYPGTGSTGDGYRFSRKFGHTVVNPSPALVPLVSDSTWVPQAQGLSLKNVEVSLVLNGKLLQKEFGEMLFTHFGVSGPVILTLSRQVTEYQRKKPSSNGSMELSIDLKPALTSEQLYERLRRDFEKYSRKQFKNSLDELLPNKLIPIIMDLSSISPDKPVHQITREERQALTGLLKGLRLDIAGTRPLSEAIITAGGISVREINPKTMESKIAPGLFFAGEVIDVDGYTGGYNLQAAWATGFVAGSSAARKALFSE